MKLTKQKRGREPDLLFVSKTREHLIQKIFLDGAADLAIEIISPESVERDSVQKFLEYEAAGIGEYWLIDPLNQIACFFTNSTAKTVIKPPRPLTMFFTRKFCPVFSSAQAGSGRNDCQPSKLCAN